MSKDENYGLLILELKRDPERVLKRLFPQKSGFWDLLSTLTTKQFSKLLGISLEKPVPTETEALKEWIKVRTGQFDIKNKTLAKEAGIKEYTFSKFLSGTRDLEINERQSILSALERLEKKIA